MNERYVNIKVDREERPDLEPVFAGISFPPTDRFRRPGFATLRSIATAWREDRENLRKRVVVGRARTCLMFV